MCSTFEPQGAAGKCINFSQNDTKQATHIGKTSHSLHRSYQVSHCTCGYENFDPNVKCSEEFKVSHQWLCWDKEML